MFFLLPELWTLILFFLFDVILISHVHIAALEK